LYICLCAVDNKKAAMQADGLQVLLSCLTKVLDMSDFVMSDRVDLAICVIRSIDFLLVEFRMYFTILACLIFCCMPSMAVAFLLSAVALPVILGLGHCLGLGSMRPWPWPWRTSPWPWPWPWPRLPRPCLTKYCCSVSQQNIRSNYLHAFDFVNKVESVVCVVRLDFMPLYSNVRPWFYPWSVRPWPWPWNARPWPWPWHCWPC